MFSSNHFLSPQAPAKPKEWTPAQYGGYVPPAGGGGGGQVDIFLYSNPSSMCCENVYSSISSNTRCSSSL